MSERALEALRLRRSGMTYKEVGERLGVGAQQARMLALRGERREAEQQSGKFRYKMRARTRNALMAHFQFLGKGELDIDDPFAVARFLLSREAREVPNLGRKGREELRALVDAEIFPGEDRPITEDDMRKVGSAARAINQENQEAWERLAATAQQFDAWRESVRDDLEGLIITIRQECDRFEDSGEVAAALEPLLNSAPYEVREAQLHIEGQQRAMLYLADQVARLAQDMAKHEETGPVSPDQEAP